MNEKDVIEVVETEHPWIHGQWLGEIVKIFPTGDGYVRPIADDLNNLTWRIKATPAYLTENGGLYLTKGDLANAKVVTDRPRV